MEKNCFPGTKDARSPTQQFRVMWQEPKDENSHHTPPVFSVNIVVPPTPFSNLSGTCACIGRQQRSISLSQMIKGVTFQPYGYISAVPLKKVVDIRTVLPKTLKALVKRNHHAYLEVTSWQKDGLRIHVWGYGDGNPGGI